MALDILCQEMYAVERNRGWFGSAEGGLPPCAGIEAGNFQRVDLFLACVLKVR